jgi:transcriptional regulator with XRE-family HTH domain
MFSMPDRIRQGRICARLSQAQLASRLGVCRSAVAQWERLDGTSPSMSHLERMATTLNVAFEWLATGRGVRGVSDGEALAVCVADFARDEVEARLLESIRRLSRRHRVMACRIIESMHR